MVTGIDHICAERAWSYGVGETTLVTVKEIRKSLGKAQTELWGPLQMQTVTRI